MDPPVVASPTSPDFDEMLEQQWAELPGFGSAPQSALHQLDLVFSRNKFNFPPTIPLSQRRSSNSHRTSPGNNEYFL